MIDDLSGIIVATAQWLTRAYPAGGGTLPAAHSLIQARQAVTVAAWLRYPTTVDAALVAMVGPGGSERLDWFVNSENLQCDDRTEDDPADAWRTWVDEVVVSWAACLLSDHALAVAAVDAVRDSAHAWGLPHNFGRLTAPDDHDSRAAALMRHPDLLAPIADLHRAELLLLLQADPIQVL